MNSLRVLIVDDEKEIRSYLKHVLSHNFPSLHQVEEADNGHTAFEKCEEQSFDLILLDVRMPVMSGLDFLKKAHDNNITSHIVVITAHGNIQDAVQSMKYGAHDYLEKPLDQEQVITIINQAMEAKKALLELALTQPVLEEDIETNLIGRSRSMKSVFALVQKFASYDTTILIRGENGTGKELVARAIHLNSNRSKEPFVAINCASIPDELIESEFFGHEKGAFTGADERRIGKFQYANKGTLFLDEIGELKYEMQAKLLRVLQEKTFLPVGSNQMQKSNARIITATNRNLEKMMIEKTFREDLFFRINVMPVFLPPLRERTEDIPYLTLHFLKQYGTHSKEYKLSEPALKKLQGYSWPGNIRQLENIVQRALLFMENETLEVSHLPDEINVDSLPEDFNFETFKQESEKQFIEKALLANEGKINRTVANANIPKNTLLRKIKKYGIDIKKLIGSEEP